jgi:hypothetical protein
VPSSQEAIRVIKDENMYDSLTAAYQAAQYRIHHNGHLAVAGQSKWRAANPAQEMTADFGDDAVRLTVSESDGATRAVTLRLTGYGYEGRSQRPVHAGLTANDNRVEYDRGVLSEWYINDARGLEQGFTLTQPPAGPRSGGLVLTMSVETELQTRLRDDGGRIQFIDSMDRVRFEYGT